MRKFLAALMISVIGLTTSAFAKSPREEAVEHVTHLYVAKQICFINIREIHFNKAIENAMAQGFSLNEIDQIVTMEAILFVKMVEQTGIPWVEVCKIIEEDVQDYVLGY